jgi:hypothetical protein
MVAVINSQGEEYKVKLATSVSDPDPHSSCHLDPDPYSECGSGSSC